MQILPKWFYSAIICCCLAQGLGAQSASLSNRRELSVELTERATKIDSLTIVPETFAVELEGAPADTSLYQIRNDSLIWHGKLPARVILRYRVLPFDLEAPAFRLDTSTFQNQEKEAGAGLFYNPFEKEEPLIDFKGLDYNGTFSRGISFGNNQDLVLNSRFNLQMAGQLGDGLEIAAAITDENIPLQAEGNTQQLREFDKIFVRLRKGATSLTAGDYELARPKGYFMQYNKKLQGATFNTSTSLGEQTNFSAGGSVAISRGQFSRNQIAQQEGNQGPYKLRGSQGELIIIVLAGTEKVWLDGALLTRGLEADYTIDYNLGEILFTHRRLITKDSRIIVEFEYADQSYVRTLTAANTAVSGKHFEGYINFFNQQDSRNSTGDEALTNEDKRLLSLAGDDQVAAFSPSIDTLDGAGATRATYNMVEATVRCGGKDTLIRYLQYDETGKYVARFTFVGAGNGDYEPDPGVIANERVYRWVQPDTTDCRMKGSYAPVKRLTAPRQQQLLTAGGAYQLPGGGWIRAEGALSKLDLNRFSALDSRDDHGLAFQASLEKRWRLGRDSAAWALNTTVGAEWLDENFKPLNPYRDPDFLRDWNLTDVQGLSQLDPTGELLTRMEIALEKPGLGRLAYGLGSYDRKGQFQGVRQNGALTMETGGWRLDAKSSWLNADQGAKTSRFQRPSVQLTKTFRKLGGWSLGAEAAREKSERFLPFSDTLEATSFFYDRYKVHLSSPQKESAQFGAAFNARNDFAPSGVTFLPTTKAQEWNINGQGQVKSTQSLFSTAGNLTYRRLEIGALNPAAQQPGETFLGRLDLNASLWKGLFRSGTTYEIGSGQEPKVDFTYVKVTQGSGTHIWLDSLYNNDGKIQVNEMEPAPFQDLADYVRVSVVTDDFIRTNNIGLNQSLQFEPRRQWGDDTGWKKVVSALSTVSIIQINRKTRESGLISWNPFDFDLPDSSLVSITANNRHTLFWNRTHPVWGLQFGTGDNRSRIVQTTGYESRRLTDYSGLVRWNFNPDWSINGQYKWGIKSSDSEFFNTRDYELRFTEMQPELTYLPSRKWRAIFRYTRREDRNTLPGSVEKALQNNLSLEATYRPQQAAYSVRFSYVEVDFKGQAGSPVGFAILNGLQPGRNLLWNLNLNRQLSANLQLSLSYEGRKTGEARVVHVGRAQVTAIF